MATRGPDKLDLTLLPDAKLKVETDEISPANHMAADNFLKFLRENGLEMESVTAKKTKRFKHKHQVEAHVHADGTAHSHE